MKDLSIWDNFVTEGRMIEVLFAQVISMYGEVTPADEKQDRYEHWDVKLVPDHPDCPLVRIYNDKKFVTFDVKSLKRVKRNETEEVDETKHYIEFKNIYGNRGWLYGMADYIVFEKFDSWVIVDRLKLIDFINIYLVNPKYCFKQPMLYAIYTRENRQDEIMLVETEKLEEISTLILKKRL